MIATDDTAPSPVISEAAVVIHPAVWDMICSILRDLRVNDLPLLPLVLQAMESRPAPPPPDGLDGLQREIGQWGESTFQHTDRGIVAHFAEEAQELVDEFSALAPGERRHPHLAPIAEEAADCLILLLNLAHYQGWSLRQALLDKHARNQKRTWGEPDANGITHHAGRDAIRPAPASPAPDAPGGSEEDAARYEHR